MILMAAASVGREATTTWDPPSVIFLKLLAILFLVLLNGFFVASEFALVKVRRSQLDALIEEGVKAAKYARHATSHLDAYLSATQLGITIASLGLGFLGEPFLARMIEPLFHHLGIQSVGAIHFVSFAIAFSVVTFLHVVLGELAPKSLAIRKAVPVSLWVARPMGFFHTVMKPLIWLFNGAANEFLRRVLRIEPVGEDEAHSTEELRLILSESQQSQEVSSIGHEIVINALDLQDRVVRDVMTPRGEVVFLDLEDGFDENLNKALESRHTRFPLCRGNLDEAMGLIHIKDLLRLVREGNRDLMAIKRELHHVSELMSVEKLLKFMLAKRCHLVLGVDEFGGTAGVVTMEDVLEEIVGSIEDEFDEKEEEFHRISDDEFDVEGSVPLYEMDEIAGIEIDSPDVTTIGGYVVQQLGHLPVEGETIEIAGYTATVAKTDGRRILSLRFKKLPPSSEESEEKPNEE